MFQKDCILSDKEINELVEEKIIALSLEEKVKLLSTNWDPIGNMAKYKNPYNPKPIKSKGNKKLGIEPLAFCDGPRGIVMEQATCFPVPIARGASFDVDLEYRIGQVMGIEARGLGANLFGGVCANVLPYPSYGRSQSTYGESVHLVGNMAKALVRGVQEQNVMACIKYFPYKDNCIGIDETYELALLKPFKRCIESGAAALMIGGTKKESDQSYDDDNNKNNDRDYKSLLDLVRREWDFEGFVISDPAFGIDDGALALEAGIDLEMPMPLYYEKQLLTLLEQEKIEEWMINEAVRRIIKTQSVFWHAKDKRIYPRNLVGRESHLDLALEAAEKSMVLIKNKDNFWPLEEVKKLLIVGDLADEDNTGDKGSGDVKSKYVVNSLEGITNYVGHAVDIEYCNSGELNQAKELALNVDAILVVAGNSWRDEGEALFCIDEASTVKHIKAGYRNQKMPLRANLASSFVKKYGSIRRKQIHQDYKGGDRKRMGLEDNDLHIIKELYEINENLGVCLIGGGMIKTDGFEDYTKSIILNWYSGMEGGSALARIMFGDINPSGKLPLTITNDSKPDYVFGHGLSYTHFKCKDHSIFLASDEIIASVVVKNTGPVDGEEVIQVYTKKNGKLELIGFSKVSLIVGEEKRVTISIPLEELKIYDKHKKQWIMNDDEYDVFIGPSSDLNKLIKEIIIL